MDAAQYEYITSERFIHDGLVLVSQRVIEEVRRVWEHGKRVDGYAITWPTKTIYAKDGTAISSAIVMELPVGEKRNEAARALVDKTGAYGLLLIEADDKTITAKFETAHGARAWTIPIERHGDRLVLGDQRVKDDADCVGLLWSPSQGHA